MIGSHTRHRLCIAAVLLLFLAVPVTTWGGSVSSLTLEAAPEAAARGDFLTYTVTIINDGTELQNLVFEGLLPAGVDQWNAEYRLPLDGVAWSLYTGTIAVGPLASGQKMTIDIRTRVELLAPAELSYTVRLRIDNNPPFVHTSLTINVLPSVDAGANRMVGLGGEVILADAIAGDGGGGIAQYLWDDGGGGGSFDNRSTLNSTFTAPAISGDITLTLTVTDHQGGRSSDSFLLWVNAFPTVDAGDDKSVNEGEVVVLSGATSDDSDGWIVSHSWSDNGGGGNFDNPNTLHPIYTAPMTDHCTGEDIILTLTVTDNQGASASDSLTVHVRNVNIHPTVDAGADQTVQEGDAVALIGSAHDPDGTITSYAWEQIGGPAVSLTGANTDHATFTAPLVPAQTELRFRLTVLDNCGGSASDSVSVRVKNINALPTADAGPNQTVQEGDWVTLAGSGSDPDGTITSYAWEQIGGPAVALTGANRDHATFTAPHVPAQTALRFRLTVTDNCGASASDEVVVTVSPDLPPPQAVSIAVEKIADREYATLGEEIVYTYTVTNTGEAILFGISAVDDVLGEILLNRTTLAPGERATGTAVTTVNEDDFPGPLVSTVTVSGRSGDGRTARASAQARVELITVRSSIEVILEARDFRGFPISPLDRLSIGDTITYVYTITNTGETILSDLSLVDDLLGNIPLTRTTLAPWERVTGSFTVTIGEEHLPGPIENTVVATGRDPGGRTVTDRDTLTLLGLAADGILELIKMADTTEAAIGDTITYTFIITNAGDIRITDLRLIDDPLGEIPLPTRVLLPGESLTVTATHTVTTADLPGPVVNTATVSGIGPLGRTTETETILSVSLCEIAGVGGVVVAELDGRVIINEVAWAGTPADPADEWIELRNLGSIPVDLSGWTIAWYPKKGPVPDEDLWTRIPLSGTITPSPIDLTQPRRERAEIVFVKQGGDDPSWRVFDMSWWVAGKEGEDGRGYFLLERRSDETVPNVLAGLIYDIQSPYLLNLPDEGAVILLIDAAGNVVDTANADAASAGGRPAGDARTRATMERSNPLAGDTADNWHTNPGVIVYGRDSTGRRMAATAGKPNSPSIDELIFLAETRTILHRAGERVVVTLEQIRREDRPAIRVAALGPVAVGGGGMVPDIAFSRRHTDEGLRLTIETEILPTGTYFIWITGGEGEVFLVPFVIER